MFNTKTYSVTYTRDLAPAPAGIFQNVMWMPEQNRQYKIKWVSWDYNFYDAVTGDILVTDTQDIIRAQFYLGFLAGLASIPITDILTNVTFPYGATDFPGTRIYMFKPNKMVFNSFVVSGALPLGIEFFNHDPINSYTFNSTVIIEIEFI